MVARAILRKTVWSWLCEVYGDGADPNGQGRGDLEDEVQGTCGSVHPSVGQGCEGCQLWHIVLVRAFIAVKVTDHDGPLLQRVAGLHFQMLSPLSSWPVEWQCAGRHGVEE